MKMKFLFQLLFMCFYWSNGIRGEDNTIDENYLLRMMVLDHGPYFYDTFNDRANLNNWIKSEAKKDGVEGELALYDGDWAIDAPIKLQLETDYGLTFKQKAKHRAISSLLQKEFIFSTKPFVLQYEVLFQDGQECGGGYLKLISGDRSKVDLKNFHDKTPYSIMFGPDKCGTTSKIHFIFRHKNPLNGSYEEKHCKQPTDRFDEVFTDGKPHLFTLVLMPDNTYSIFLDHKVMTQGSLLNDFTPAVNPPAEIDDPNDVKPESWDEREFIPDPDAKKPEDWDEDAPHMIQDPTATKPDNWLDNEPTYIRDPSAEKPHDWDNEMDGEWEAPLVPNPACEDAAGCGEWVVPKINNPDYKGKWSAPLIANPNYKGKWSPRKIPNENYFEDKHPFKMDKIVAVGFELWSMSANILFDNILITDSVEFAEKWALATFDNKVAKIEKSADSLVSQFVSFSNKYPWLWALYTIVLLVFITLIVHCCFWSNKDDSYEHKKTDEPQSDVIEEPVEESVEEPAEKPVEEPVKKPDEKSVEEAAEATVTKSEENIEPNEKTEDTKESELKDSTDDLAEEAAASSKDNNEPQILPQNESVDDKPKGIEEK